MPPSCGWPGSLARLFGIRYSMLWASADDGVTAYRQGKYTSTMHAGLLFGYVDTMQLPQVETAIRIRRDFYVNCYCCRVARCNFWIQYSLSIYRSVVCINQQFEKRIIWMNMMFMFSSLVYLWWHFNNMYVCYTYTQTVSRSAVQSMAPSVS